jgi:hypothetical protein
VYQQFDELLILLNSETVCFVLYLQFSIVM